MKKKNNNNANSIKRQKQNKITTTAKIDVSKRDLNRINARENYIRERTE